MTHGSLTLSRKQGDSIEIETPQGTITITVSRASGPVALRLHAPRDFRILRTELLKGERHDE